MQADVARTKAYYASISPSSLCDCAYCRNYRAQIRAAFPKIAAYLGSLGVDIEKPLENSPLDPDEKGMLEYCCCQYVVFGVCEPEYRHWIDQVEFRPAASYPGTNIEEAHFVIEFFGIQLSYGA